MAKRTRKKASMRQEIKGSWVGQAWGKDARKMARIDRARRKEATRQEADADRPSSLAIEGEACS